MMGGYYMQPQMQMMLKWRNQMAHMVRNSPEAMQVKKFISRTHISTWNQQACILPILEVISPE